MHSLRVNKNPLKSNDLEGFWRSRAGLNITPKRLGTINSYKNPLHNAKHKRNKYNNNRFKYYLKMERFKSEIP